MLDSFLKVACSHSIRETEQARLVDKMKQLPEEVLHKIASGEEKLAYYGDCASIGGAPESWLDKFKGTPLFEQAIEIEKQDLQEEMAQSARYREEDQMRSAQSAARDERRVQRKILELQLAELEAGGGEPQAFAGEETPEEEALEHGMGSPEEMAAMQQPPQQPQAQPPAPPKEEPAPEKQAMKFAYAMMKMAKKKEALLAVPGDVGAAVGIARTPEDGNMALNAARGAAGEIGGTMLGGALGTAVGQGVGHFAGGRLGALVEGPLARRALNNSGLVGAALGGLGGAAYGIKKMTDPRQQAVEPAAEEQPVQAGMPEHKMAAAMKKHAIGLGMLGSAAMGAAKSVGGAGAKAVQSARGFGANPMQAAKMGLGAVKGQAPGALNTLGRAATSYAKSNPLQAAGLAGAAGLGVGAALS